jgi:DNA-directed DNA polymerase III PolC
MKVSPHTHGESHLTGSTLVNLIKRAKDLGREYFAFTDHGHLSSALKAYGLTKKSGLKFIPGLEIYFKDSRCPFVAGTPAERCRYFTGTIYCKNQEAYQALSKLISRTNMPTIELYEEKQQLWSWSDLEHISKYQVSFVAGGIHDMAGKCVLAGAAPAGQQVLLRLKEIFKENLAVALIAEPYTKKWSNVVEIKYTDGTKDTLLANDLVTTDKARKIKASDLTEKKHHAEIKAKYIGSTYFEVDKTLESATLHKGFLPLPGGDAMTKINRFLLILAEKNNIPVLASDYAYYANQDDKIVQTMRLEGTNKLQPNLHMKTEEEVNLYLLNVLNLRPEQAQSIIQNNETWAKQFDGFKLDYPWRLAEVEGGNALQKVIQIIKENGRMKWDDPKYTARLKEELEVIHKNGVYDLLPYFLPIRDVLNYYKENGQLTGPGRGSAGGSLLCYLMGITQINPFDYDLPFQRFFSMVRIKGKKLPDIDVDLENRELLIGEDSQSGYLYSRWGDKAAQISTRTTIRLKSAILDTNRYFNNGKVEDSVSTLSKGFPSPPQGITDHQFVFGYEDTDENHIKGLFEVSEDLQKYATERPKEWEIVSKAMGLTRAYSKHASAFVIADVPISDVIPTKDGNVTQYEAKEAEAAGLIKYDLLVIKQLKDIRVCLDLINKKNQEVKTVGQFTHEGKELYVWDLPEVPEVFQSTWTGQTETMFQINTTSMRPHVIEMLPKSIMDGATLIALIRPGPLDYIDPNTGRNMVEEYMLRRRGEVEPDIPEMVGLLPETYGVLVFQEDLNKIARGLAGMDPETAELLRENMAKKKMVELTKMKPAFIAGAKQKVSEEVAEKIWEQMVTFGRYGFSIIHAVEYFHITYACMFLKHFYPMEWWASILTNATEQEITGVFWPYVKDLVLPPDINLSSDTMVVDYANNKLRAKLGIIRGMGENTIDPIIEGRPYKDVQDFVNRDVAGDSLSHKLIHVGVLDSLFPPKRNLLEKLKMYEDAVEIKKFNDKIKKAESTGKKTRIIQPKEGQIPEAYLNLEKDPLKEAAMKKAVLPSMPLDLHSLGRQYSKALDHKTGMPTAIDSRGYRSMLISGEKLKRLAEITGETLEKDMYVATTCFVVEAKEFSYSGGQKRALKLSLDADGYTFSDMVLWPDYESGKLIYPQELKKGSIITAFFRKRVNKKDLNVTSLVVET